MIRRPPRSTLDRSSAASDVYKRQGFAFVARQQRISTETQDFYIDLVFYNYLIKCFVLIDLKTGPLTHQDVGQMDMYVRMYLSLIHISEPTRPY